MVANASSEESDTDGRSPIAFDRAVDWAIGCFLALVGLLLALGGVGLNYAVERPWMADAIRNGEFQSDVLTEAEAIDIAVALGDWVGIGLAVAGVAVVLVGVAGIVVHRRARQRGRGTPRWILGVVGATVGFLLGFVPFSPVLGGAVAGYLDPDESASGLAVGTMAGLFSTLPVVILLGFAGVGLFTAIAGDVAALVTAGLAVLVLFSLAYFVGLSALGGYVGSKLR